LNWNFDFLPFLAWAPFGVLVNKALVFFDRVEDSFDLHLEFVVSAIEVLRNNSLRNAAQDAFNKVREKLTGSAIRVRLILPERRIEQCRGATRAPTQG
jgi:hypothetical protein